MSTEHRSCNWNCIAYSETEDQSITNTLIMEHEPGNKAIDSRRMLTGTCQATGINVIKNGGCRIGTERLNY
jgi:hypothetical protein